MLSDPGLEADWRARVERVESRESGDLTPSNLTFWTCLCLSIGKPTLGPEGVLDAAIATAMRKSETKDDCAAARQTDQSLVGKTRDLWGWCGTNNKNKVQIIIAIIIIINNTDCTHTNRATYRTYTYSTSTKSERKGVQ